jgi:hypothetical protein
MAISIILPVIDETTSLQRTVEILLDENPAAIREILIIVYKTTTPESRSVFEALVKNYPHLVHVGDQVRPFAVERCGSFRMGQVNASPHDGERP